MKCDADGCNRVQRFMHRQIGTPSIYYCCQHNGCSSFRNFGEVCKT